MNINIYSNKIANFLALRLAELIGIFFIFTSIFFVLTLISYSPEDPNFIVSKKFEIKNLMGFRGSYTSDILLQSFGLVAYLIPLNFFLTGFNLILIKKISIIIENLFFLILSLLSGSIFFDYFYQNSFKLSINGNGGFLGRFLNELVFNKIINLNEKIIFYILIIITILLFILSFKLNLKKSLSSIKFIFNFLNKNNKKNTSLNEEVINEFEKKEKIEEERIQENLPFSSKNQEIKKNKFKLPSLNFLKQPAKKEKEKNNFLNKIDGDALEKILLDFGVEGKIKKISHGPVVTLNEFEPAAGIKVSKIINLSEDIARNTSSESARISVIPGSSTIGIELPNSSRENVYLSEIISDPSFKKNDNKLLIALGKSISGIPIISDLSSMPHLLIAGTTGSGKSVCINTIILSLLYKHNPDICKFILIDPKMLELSTYEGIPHLLCPVITEAKRAASVLGWVVKEMESRYRLMTRVGVKNIDGYNKKHKLPMPYIIVIVDEMSDLMLVAGKEIEGYIQKLSQMARAAGIHIIMATQRPSVDVITGTIKANFPTRISFQVSSKIDSRTILGEQGAEQLLGKGDMLYMSSANKIVRIHAPYVSETEIEKINNFLRSQAEPNYVDEILNFADEKEIDSNLSDENKDELYQTAIEIIKSEGKASTSFLQRKLQIGYNRAARIIDMMESEGIVSKANHVGKREVLK